VQIAKQTLWKYSYPKKYWWKLFVSFILILIISV